MYDKLVVLAFNNSFDPATAAPNEKPEFPDTAVLARITSVDDNTYDEVHEHVARLCHEFFATEEGKPFIGNPHFGWYWEDVYNYLPAYVLSQAKISVKIYETNDIDVIDYNLREGRSILTQEEIDAIKKGE